MQSLRPLVISGPSGAGKSTLLKLLLDKHKGFFEFCVSHTTRSPRQGEKNGVDYHFTTRNDFVSDIKNNMFLEHAEFAGNLYGTSLKSVKDVLNSGKICILDVDLAGVKSIYNLSNSINAKYIFVRPPSLETLEKRLRDRGTETEEKILARLSRAGADIDFSEGEGKAIYDAVIVNDDLEVAFEKLEGFLDEDIKAVKSINSSS